MPREKPQRKVSGLRFHPEAGQYVRKSRRPSVQKLQEVEIVSEHLKSLRMSTTDSKSASSHTEKPLPPDPDDLAQQITQLLQDREKPLRILKTFSSVSPVTRQMLVGVQNKVSLYTKVKDMDTKLDYLYSEWLDCCDKSTEELEGDSDPLRPSVLTSKFSESGEIIDSVEAAFKVIKDKFTDKQVVIDHLDFIDHIPKSKSRDSSVGSDKGNSVSVAFGRGEEYIKAKLPKLKKEIETRFEVVKKKFEETEEMSTRQLYHILKQLDGLVDKLADDSPFENLLKDAYSFPDFDVSCYEDWQATQRALVESLLSSIDEAIEKKEEEKETKAGVHSAASKPTYNTFLKKQDPPTFSGDCLDFMEFRRKWSSQVSAHNPPTEYEMDLLKRSIPEEGKKKLYGVDSITTAWAQLEKLYGDKSLICQKLKSRLKNLKPSSTESHEIIIEIQNEIEYLVKRLKDVDAVNLLYFDIEYLNVCYKHLPPLFQHEWDKFDTDEFSNSWIGFMDFMNTNAKAALKKRTLMESLKDMGEDVKIKKGVKASATVGFVRAGDEKNDESVELSEQQKEKFQKLKKKAGYCKLCKAMHTFQSRWMKTPLPSDRFFNCDKFKNMTAKARGETLQKFSSCVRCTSWLHKKSDCQSLAVSCREQLDGTACGKDHSRLVCQSGVPYCTQLTTRTSSQGSKSLRVSDIDENVQTIPYIQDLTVASKGEKSQARAYWDGGSNRVLVNNEYAMENNMTPSPVTVIMKTAGGGREKLEANLFELHLVERNGICHRIWGYGVDTILEPDDPVDPSSVRHLFPHVPKEVFVKIQKRRIDILIGLNYNGLFPTGGTGKDCNQNMRIMQTRFGDLGWILGGSHADLQCSNPQLSSGAARILTAARLQCVPDVLVEDNSVQIAEDVKKISVLKLSVEPGLTAEYWDKDNLGIQPPRRCVKCKQCAERGDCSEKHLIHTLEEENDLRAIEENIEVIDGVTHVKYPFKKDPSCLPYNRNTAVNIAGRLWKSLEKDGLLQAYNAEIQKYLDRDTFIQLSKEEMSDYAGPVQYITHHAVLKDSTSTPLRVVTNSSFKNGKYSLNDILPKGPNSLNDMLEVTIRFRAYKKVFATDLAKAYNTMKTGLIERHVRRFIWKFSEEGPWIDFAIDCVHFGDRPAACQLEISKKKIAELGEQIDPEAAKKLVQDSYVDDIFSGGGVDEIQRMVGVKDSDGNYSGTISRILALGGYKVKEFVIEGDGEEGIEEKNLLSNSVFGYYWDPASINMKLIISLNLSKKKRSVRILPAIVKEDLENLASIKMTKRNLLGVTNSFGDYLGLADPFTIRFKLLMKNLFDQKSPLLWDDAVPDVEKQAWVQLISEAVQSGEHVFPRKTRPDRPVGGPRVVGFGDGAFPAYGGCVYLVWEHGCDDLAGCVNQYCQGEAGGHYAAYLALAKGRVTPLSGFTIPRSEMSGAVVVSRLVLRVVRALQPLTEKPSSSIILLDSECTISTLETSASQLKPFFHNRRSEILENMENVSKYCEMEPVHWVASAENSADLLTRGTARLCDIGPGSVWLLGPKFFSSPRRVWAVNRDCVSRSDKIPKEEMRTPHSWLRVAAVQLESPMPVPFRTVESILKFNNSLESRKRVLARIIKGWGEKSYEEASKDMKADLTRTDLEQAERLLLLHGMVQTVQAFEQGQLTSLMPFRSGRLIVTRGRLGEGVLEPLLGVSELPILMPESRVAELYMVRAHRGHSGLLHRSVAETLARSRSSVWVVRAKQLAKKVCHACMECRRQKHQLLGQQMASLGSESSTVCPPWTHIALDYAGPVVLRGEVNTRSRGKGWILVYVCKSTKAVCLLPTASYDTAAFLVRHREFVARKGRPRSIVSDRGTQLVKSGLILAKKNSPKGWDWASVVRNNSASDWKFVPIGAAHRNGLAEATVKVLKQSLKHALAPGVILSFSEMNTLLAEISFTVNCRPLGLGNVSGDSQQEDHLSPVTPNQLLLGRTDDDGPPLDFTDEDKYTARLGYVTQVYTCWWDKWIKQVLPTLMPLRRWRKKKENLQEGDVVMMMYPGNFKNDYRLAKVLKTHPDKRGLVRTVTVGFRRKDAREKGNVYKSKPLVEEQVAVQRLSLLVAAGDVVKEASSKANPENISDEVSSD